ncbi:hypothetical protein PQU92_09360 [Asticcacaulis sp. BYS171W]|uniref:Uncharacterized protein n=1 Tax=Asticcacaulis aquaticus TaxID=2984212 RepID=A0ABT5HU81_9CAUL|nr:hypothetical protein [Asticcacaulis aquaticus]MDC7683482.1 hypothetical protein [Asticcacaulis aquaticus]
MLDDDNLFTGLALASVALALIVGLWLLLSAFAHLGLALIRALSGKRARVNGWTAARALIALGALAIVATGHVAVQHGMLGDHPLLLPAGGLIALFGLIGAPLLLVIARIRLVDMERPQNAEGWPRLKLALKNGGLVLALPGMMTLLVTGSLLIDTNSDPASGYYILPRPTACSVWLRGAAPIDLPPQTEPRTTGHLAVASEFWLDSTVNALTFSLFDATGCYLRRVDYNRESPRMVASVITYNLILIFVVSTIVVSIFRHKVRQGITRGVNKGLSAHRPTEEPV